MAYKSPEKNPPPPNVPPPEMMISFDEQVVACEIEVDTFDREIEGFKEEGNSGEYQNTEEDVPGNSEYQYYEEGEEEVEVEMDPNSVFLFDEDTSQMHQINEDPPEEYEYLEDVTSSSEVPGPSTSTSHPSTSSAPSQKPPTRFQAHQRGLIRYETLRNSQNSQNHQTTYYIRKEHGIGARGGPGEEGQTGYSPVHFQTQYSIEPLARSGKRVMKRTHALMSAEEMETMMEDAQVMKRIQTEIDALKKTNDAMKKDYETSHRQLEALNMVWVEAKQKQREALEEKKELTRALTKARATHTQLVKQVNCHHHNHHHNPPGGGPPYQFH